MEEYHVKITVERGGESQCVNTTAKTAIYLSVLGFVLVGIPYGMAVPRIVFHCCNQGVEAQAARTGTVGVADRLPLSFREIRYCRFIAENLHNEPMYRNVVQNFINQVLNVEREIG